MAHWRHKAYVDTPKSVWIGSTDLSIQQECLDRNRREGDGKKDQVPKSTWEVVKIRTVKDEQDLKQFKNKRKKWASLGVGDIVVDSAADESCWPKDLGGAFKTKPSTKNILLRTANGGEMCHYGEKEVTLQLR